MSKLVVIPDTKESIVDYFNNDCFVIVGIDGFSVNTLNINMDELTELLSINNNIFVSLNKNILNSELKCLESLLIDISKLNVKGVFYYDVCVLNIVNRLNLDINLIWSAEHLTTNYFTVNYWYKNGIKGTYLSSEITYDEIKDISLNTKCKLFVQLFGYISMYVSKRHAIKNYLKHFNIENSAKEYKLYKEDKLYSIKDNNDGTTIYTDFILNGLKESLLLKDSIDYIVLNAYKIDTKDMLDVIDIYSSVNNDNIEVLENRLTNIFNNLSKGFLYEETIYRVKKYDK